MTLGIPLSSLTTVHAAVSLIGLVSGLVALFVGPLGSRTARATTAVFLSSTLATSVTGLMFPYTHLGPGHVTGLLTLVALAPAFFALHRYRLEGPWRRVYAISAAVALYFNILIAILQAFGKIELLHPLAASLDTLVEAATQIVVLVLFLALWLLAARPSSVRSRTPGPQQPRVQRARFLRTTNRRSFT